MNLRGIICFLLLSAALAAAAKPARPGVLTFTQPDGTTFRARLSGDEFSKRLLLEDGCALVQDADGFYCYAAFDSRGRSVSSGR
ncbi:MAG: peptidase M6, partial [Bacteroidales bacterium]|nr:peptidase M6 [Bacteroidales bacterium]